MFSLIRAYCYYYVTTAGAGGGGGVFTDKNDEDNSNNDDDDKLKTLRSLEAAEMYWLGSILSHTQKKLFYIEPQRFNVF